jgi:Vacuolar protein sorting-associated protein 62
VSLELNFTSCGWPAAPPAISAPVTPCLYSNTPQFVTAFAESDQLPSFSPARTPEKTEYSEDWNHITLVGPQQTVGSGSLDHENTSTTDLCLEDEGMKKVKTKATIGLLSTLITYISFNSILRATHPDLFVWRPDDREDVEWTATSKSWLDRKACRWLGICGGAHVHLVGNRFGRRPSTFLPTDPAGNQNWTGSWHDQSSHPDQWSDQEKLLRQIPEYVMEYAPLVHLYSGEQFWPCNIAEHLYHIRPDLNYTPIESNRHHPTLKHLDRLNEFDEGRWVYLTSNDNVEERPEWLEGEKNIPVNPSNSNSSSDDDADRIHHPGSSFFQSWIDGIGDMKDWFAPGLQELDLHEDFRKSQYPLFSSMRHGLFGGRYHAELRRRNTAVSSDDRLKGGRSGAPAVLVAVDKGHGVVDAFWFFFYSFNLGNVVFNVRFGNHVGDWEHTMIRFHHGKPKAVFFSEHNFGSAYSYEAVEKIGRRPVIYSAVGTHAMYATPGSHPYVLPWGILHDQTDRGPLWDPALNSHSYTYDPVNETLRASTLTPHSPIAWFDYAGRWGDKFYPLGDKRQYRFLGQYHYVSGPTGPKFKHLNRKKICQGPTSAPCVIKHWIGGTDNLRFSGGLDEDDKKDIDD